MEYSVNPYQGCEHGCSYCYARNAHFYWGFSAGLDFETKLIVKPKAAELVRQEIGNKNWKVAPIVLSGNTDCYQPIEKKYELTRKILALMLETLHPVSIITKNALILRDLDLISALSQNDLIHVSLSITTLNEDLRRKLEPRTASVKSKLKALKILAENNVPVNVMTAPIIPGLNSSEIPELLKTVAGHGARSAAYTMVRLNGALPAIFSNWIKEAFPLKAEKVLNQIKAVHKGKLNDSTFGDRMTGTGVLAEQIRQLYNINYLKYFKDAKKIPPYNLTLFKRPNKDGQLRLF